MLEQREAAIEFPTAGVTGGLSWVKVRAYLTSHGDRKSCSYSDRTTEIKQILGHARDGEDLETVQIDVVIRFSDPDFDGRSYGLALALADKRARFGERGPFERIIATGVLSNQGVISRVDAFPQKLALVLESLDPNSLFLLPKENLDSETDLLEKVAVSGGKMRAVSQLSELRDLWQEDLSRPEQHRFMSHSKGSFIKGVIFGFSAVSLITGVSIFLFRSLTSQ